MKRVTKEMLKIYKPISDLDWLNYKIVRKSDLTFHHIQKRCDGGKEIISNGALLIPVAHEYLHLIEYKDIGVYLSINKIFEIVNKQSYEPTQEQREIIEYLLREFERIHRKDRNSKGKSMIQYKYLKRGFNL